MSASSKKKLRKELNAAQMTERQRQEQKAAKSLKRNTIIFITAMVLIVCIVIGALTWNRFGLKGVYYGSINKDTTAATVGDHTLNTVMLNYYYKDLINEQYNTWYSSYSSYVNSYVQMLYGLDLTKSIGSQYYDPDNGITWADHFVSSALDEAKSTYALYDAAVKAGFKLSEDDETGIQESIDYMSDMASLYGYSDVDDYLEAAYGYGSDLNSYSEYIRVGSYAMAYARDYIDSLEYDDAALREYEKDHFDEFSSFSYRYYHINHSSYLAAKAEGDTSAYTEDEKEAARVAAKAAADALAKASSTDDLDKQIAELPFNKEKENVSSIKMENTLYGSVTSVMRDWIVEAGREAGDTTVIASTTTNTGDDGKEVTVVTGYYVVFFEGRNDNEQHLANVRHLLVKFEGGTTDDDGNTVYSDDEKKKAKDEADGYLKTWKEGKADEDSFIALVKEHSDDSSASEGGLFEDITPDSPYVENFLNWSIDESRVKGDTAVIETEHGYHVMYYVGDDELTYRDYMITQELENEDYTTWYEAIVEAAKLVEGDTSGLNRDLVLSYGY